MRYKTVDILGIPIADVNMSEALALVEEYLESGNACVIYTPNAEMIMAASRNPEFADILRNADLLLPDGAGVVLGSKILGTPLKEKVSGIDLVKASFKIVLTAGKSYFLLGGSPGVAEDAASKIRSEYTGIMIAGFHHGFFKPDEEQGIVNAINASGASVLLVGMGVPKQEVWINGHSKRLNVRICMGVGGSFDILAGKVKLAPAAFRDNGLEWLYRLIKEPYRYKRMLDLPRFIVSIVSARLTSKSKHKQK